MARHKKIKKQVKPPPPKVVSAWTPPVATAMFNQQEIIFGMVELKRRDERTLIFDWVIDAKINATQLTHWIDAVSKNIVPKRRTQSRLMVAAKNTYLYEHMRGTITSDDEAVKLQDELYEMVEDDLPKHIDEMDFRREMRGALKPGQKFFAVRLSPDSLPHIIHNFFSDERQWVWSDAVLIPPKSDDEELRISALQLVSGEKKSRGDLISP